MLSFEQLHFNLCFIFLSQIIYGIVIFFIDDPKTLSSFKLHSIQLNLIPNKEPQGTTNTKVTKENGPQFGKSNFGFTKEASERRA